ncbi:hypothetical protein [Rhizobium leguminosarum]|uniref:hypothetical protein n=1 Tax=Rhizobium leguminosarum TaxID=384 RepID=UPI000CF57DF2|nr:hypothetical protein [Rhizobium leguminosarum]
MSKLFFCTLPVFADGSSAIYALQAFRSMPPHQRRLQAQQHLVLPSLRMANGRAAAWVGAGQVIERLKAPPASNQVRWTINMKKRKDAVATVAAKAIW